MTFSVNEGNFVPFSRVFFRKKKFEKLQCRFNLIISAKKPPLLGQCGFTDAKYPNFSKRKSNSNVNGTVVEWLLGKQIYLPSTQVSGTTQHVHSWNSNHDSCPCLNP